MNAKIKYFTPVGLSAEIVWSYDGIEYISMMYHHSDGSWGFDSGTKKLPAEVQEALKLQLFSKLSNPKPVPKKKVSKPYDPNKPRIRVWFAE